MILPPAGILPIDLDWDAVDGLSRTYALGVPEIDSQHRMLFAWCVALRKRPGQQVAEGLMAYAAGHFADEEAWAADRGIDITWHQRRHDELLARLEQLPHGVGRTMIAALVYDWLIHHIDVEDRALVAQDRTL
jgi:hemerythrin-like metal-binding protein